jgi:uncharacterized Zn-finger protein
LDSDLSDLDAEGEDEDEDEYQPSDEEFTSCPPAKKNKTVASSSGIVQSRAKSRRRRAGKKKVKFYCENCNKSCTRLADLKRHRDTACHNKPKSEGPIQYLPCPSCPSAFSRADALKRHRENTHAVRFLLFLSQCLSMLIEL